MEQLKKADIVELLAFRQPPASVIKVFEGLIILLSPSESSSDWYQIHKWLARHQMQLLSMMLNYDRNQMTDEQLTRLNAILAEESCQPERVRKCSLAAYGLSMWLRAVTQYAALTRQQQT